MFFPGTISGDLRFEQSFQLLLTRLGSVKTYLGHSLHLLSRQFIAKRVHRFIAVYTIDTDNRHLNMFFAVGAIETFYRLCTGLSRSVLSRQFEYLVQVLARSSASLQMTLKAINGLGI